MNLALETTHYSTEGLPGGKSQKFSTSLASGENFGKVIEEEAIYLPKTSRVPVLATEPKTKHSALPKVTRT